MMKTLFYYCYYRIASFYRSCYDGDYLNQGYSILFFTFFLITSSIGVPISSIINKELTKIDFFIMGMPFFIWYIWIVFFLSKEYKMEKFKQLEKRYKNENHKKLKGWLIALYAFGTLVLYLVMLGIFV